MLAGGVLCVAGLLVCASGVAGLSGRLRRNRWAGVRTTATMRNDDTFEIGNRAAGPAVIVGGLLGVAGGLVAMVAPVGTEPAWVLAGAIAMVVLVLAGGFRGDRAARQAGR